MSPTLPTRTRSSNLLLSSLEPENYARLAPHLHTVRLESGAPIGRRPGESSFAYFPTTCVVSLICEMEDGATAEVALTGNEGVLGISLFLGGNSATNRAIVGIAGEAQRMDARVLKDQFMRCDAFQRVLLQYTEALIAQISITAACNRRHTLEKRLCRWLLLLHDRATSDEFVMTQEFIANMLGGRRETVTVAAGHLQDAGLIHYTRGHLKIIDRQGLENSVCECYRNARGEVLRPVQEKTEIDQDLRKTRISNVLS